MERRVLLAVVLSMAVLYAYQTFLAPPPPEPVKTAQSQPGKPSPTPPSTAGAAAPAAQTAQAAPAAPVPQSLVGDASEREIVIETADVQAVLTNRGARILHWRLKHYLDEAGKPVDLVPSALPPNQPTPFSLVLEDQQLT